MLQRLPKPELARACEGFVGIPLARPTRIVLAADPAALGHRENLWREMRRELHVLGRSSMCGGPGDLGCWATYDERARNVLVVLATDDSPTSVLSRRVDEWLDRGFEVIALASADADLDIVLPESLKRSNVIPWLTDPRDTLPSLLDLVLLDIEDRRIFISYARADGSTVAEDVFDRLARLRFDVFLDRFRIPPGADFVVRLQDEILDKAMVVVVETPAALASHWTRHEVEFAAARGIGLAAVNAAAGFEISQIGARIPAVAGMDAICDFLVEQHRLQLLARREALHESVRQALRDSGALPSDLTPTAQGLAVQARGSRRLVSICTRPSDLHRFRLTHEEAAGDRAFLVHPRPGAHRTRRDLDWISAQSGVVEVDEGRIVDAAPKMLGLP